MQHKTAPVPGGQPKILLAEDHEDTRLVYGMVLRHYGYLVDEVANGFDAVERARATRPDLILMDIGLPGMDGWEAARRLKASADTDGILLVAFSALIDCIADLGADGASFDGFIAKPVSPTELARRVGAYLELTGRGSARRSEGAYPYVVERRMSQRLVHQASGASGIGPDRLT
jgi:CheY-like chemotaxis protein